MLHTITKLTTVRDFYGDYQTASTEDLKCHFRDIADLSTTTNNEQVQADATCWLESDASVAVGTLLAFGGTTYRIERITRARRLRSSEVQFLKCDLLIYGAIS